MHREHHDAALLRPHGDEVLPAIRLKFPPSAGKISL
jgi:hypothetical protein